jgi:thymidylate synthase (FAD)
VENVEPKVFLIGETVLNNPGLDAMLRHYGASHWGTDAGSDSEVLIEIMGRLCYRSFSEELNPNLTKVRDGNQPYLANILKSGHGSVLEHATLNFVFCDVSRVFTHELVRHRAGTAMSQESLRFVRLEDLKAWFPACITESESAMTVAAHVFQTCELAQKQLAELFEIDTLKFSEKKKLTSAMRRMAPMGLATNIGWSANIRAVRHVLEMRTHPSAEIEIRKVFSEVGKLCKLRYPNLFQDYVPVRVDGLLHFSTENNKV